MPHNEKVITSLALAPSDHAALAALVDDLQRVFGVRLFSAAAYGLRARAAGDPMHVIALVERLTVDDLSACARQMPAWQRAGIGAPLLLERAEFERTLDVFPLEYGEIIAHHLPLLGNDPFAGLEVAAADVRRAVELHAKSLLIHLREGFLESGGDGQQVNRLIVASVPGFDALLTNLARLCGDGGEDLPEMAARCLGVPASTVRDVLSAGGREVSAAEDLTPLLMRYLEAAARIWSHVDGWRA